MRSRLGEERHRLRLQSPHHIGGDRALSVDADADDLASEAFQQIDQGREGRLLDEDRRAERENLGGDAVEGIEASVDDRQ